MRPVMATSSVLSETVRSMPTRLVVAVDSTEVGGDRVDATRSRHARGLVGVAEADVDPRRAHELGDAGRRALAGREVPQVAQRVVGRDADRGVGALRARLRPRAVEVLHAVATRAVEPGEQPRRRAGVERRGHARERRLLRRSRRHADTLRPGPTPADDIPTPRQWALAATGRAVCGGAELAFEVGRRRRRPGPPSGCSGALARPTTAATTSWPVTRPRRSWAPRRARGGRGRARGR